MAIRTVQSSQTSRQSLQSTTTQNDLTSKVFQSHSGITTRNQLSSTYHTWNPTSTANHTDARVQFQMGKFYQSKGEHQTAFNWLLRAAKQNLPEAQVAVGHCFENGLGVLESITSASTWYENADQQNSALGSYAMGHFLERHGEVDKSIPYYIKASELGSVDAKEALDRLVK